MANIKARMAWITAMKWTKPRTMIRASMVMRDDQDQVQVAPEANKDVNHNQCQFKE